MSDEASTSVAPMTRAQQFQWHLEKGIADGMRRLPDGCSHAWVQGLVESLQRQYEILRTSIDMVNGACSQRVHKVGEPVMTVHLEPDADLASGAAALAAKFIDSTVGRLGKILVHFYLLQQGSARWLAIIADSTAVDRACYEMLVATIGEMLGEAQETRRRPGDAGPGLQPAQLALREGSPEGQAERQKAREYLSRHFETAPPPLHPRYGFTAARTGTYYRCSLTVPHADRIFAQVIEKTGRLPSAAILGAFAALMCWRSEVPSCTVNISMENRYSRDLSTARCATAQRAPVTLRVPSDVLDDTTAAVQATLAADYPVAGRYDAFDLIEERSAAQTRRGVCLKPDLAFNFNPPLQGWTALVESTPPGGAPGEESDGKIDTWLTNETSYEYAASLSVRWTDTSTARLSVHGDSRALSVADCAVVLRGIEAWLREIVHGAASGGLAGIAASAGLAKAERSPHQVRASGFWWDLGAIESCLLEISEIKRVGFSFEGEKGDGLTVKAVVPDGVTLSSADLRSLLLGHVRTGVLAVIPEFYKIVRG